MTIQAPPTPADPNAEDVLVHASVPSPIGEILLVGDRTGAVHGLYMQDAGRPRPVDPVWRHDEAALAPVIGQLDEYFAGQRTHFDLDVKLRGRPFQVAVWHALLEIPYGATTTYGELARRLGRPAGARAVGLANGQNPIAVIVPCHRVIGAGGALVGYGGGLARKRRLLDLEAGILHLT